MALKPAQGEGVSIIFKRKGKSYPLPSGELQSKLKI